MGRKKRRSKQTVNPTTANKRKMKTKSEPPSIKRTKKVDSNTEKGMVI